MDPNKTIRINMIVNDGDKNKKVINLNRTEKIILNKSYLQCISEDPVSSASAPPVPKVHDITKNLKRTNLFLIGSHCKEEVNTFFPVRVQFTERSLRLGFNKGQNNTTTRSTLLVPNKNVKKEEEKSVTPKLNENDIQSLIKDVLTKNLTGQKYDHVKCKSKSTELSIAIHDRLKVLCRDVYKIAVEVFIGEVRGDGMETATQCIWNPTTDCVVSSYFKNSSLIATATVFASYCK